MHQLCKIKVALLENFHALAAGVPAPRMERSVFPKSDSCRTTTCSSGLHVSCATQLWGSVYVNIAEGT